MKWTTKDQQGEDKDRTEQIEKDKSSYWDESNLTFRQTDERPGRTDDIEEGKKEGGGGL